MQVICYGIAKLMGFNFFSLHAKFWGYLVVRTCEGFFLYCRCNFSDVCCIDVFVYVVLRHSCVVQGFYTPR